MKKLIFACMAALSLAACETVPASGEIATPAPLAGTSVDDQAIAFAFEAADVIRATVGQLRVARHACCVPGTPAAQTMANRLDQLAAVLRAASAAQRLGNEGLALSKLGEARQLVSSIRSLLPGRGGTSGLDLQRAVDRAYSNQGGDIG